MEKKIKQFLRQFVWSFRFENDKSPPFFSTYFFFQYSVPSCMHAPLCLTLGDPMDWSPPGSSVHEIFPGENTGVGFHLTYLKFSERFSCLQRLQTPCFHSVSQILFSQCLEIWYHCKKIKKLKIKELTALLHYPTRQISV